MQALKVTLYNGLILKVTLQLWLIYTRIMAMQCGIVTCYTSASTIC